MNATNFRKMYTPEEIKAIAGGGGGGKLYLHVINFFRSTGLIKTPEDNILVTSITLYIICSSPVLLDSWTDYQNLITKNQTHTNLYIPFNYDNIYSSSQDTIISSANTYIYNTPNYKSLVTNIRYFKIGSTNTHLSNTSSSDYAFYYDKDDSIVIPLE